MAACAKPESLDDSGVILTTDPSLQPRDAAPNWADKGGRPYTPPFRDKLQPGDLWATEATAGSTCDIGHTLASPPQLQQYQQSPSSSSSGFAARRNSLLMRSAEFSHLATCCEEEEQQGKERDESSSPLPSGQLLEGGSAWAASSSMRHSRRPPPARSSSDRVSGRGSVFSSYGRKGGASVGGGAAAGTASGARRVSAVQQSPFHQTSASLSVSLTGTIVSGSMLSSNGRSGPQSTSADTLMRDLASMRAIGRAGAQCTVYQVRSETSY